MAVRLATRLAAVNMMGGNAVFGDLKPGDRFHFPKHPERTFVKGKGGWYRTERLLGLTGGPFRGAGAGPYRTGSGTAVVKL